MSALALTAFLAATVAMTSPAAAAPAAASHNPSARLGLAISGQTMTASGFAYDPDAIWSPVGVWVFADNRLVAFTHAVGKWHHYSIAFRLAPGNHRIRAIAGNIGAGTGNTSFGGAWRTIASPVPAWHSAYGGSQRIAASMLAAYGWGPSQMSPLIALWNKESGWNPGAYNPSGAYGIPQALPGGKMASAGADWRTNPATQIRWGLGYIKGIYGSPAAAWGHSQATNWY